MSELKGTPENPEAQAVRALSLAETAILPRSAPQLIDAAEVRLHVAMGYLAGNSSWHMDKDPQEVYQDVHDIAKTALEEWAEARIKVQPLLSESASKGSTYPALLETIDVLRQERAALLAAAKLTVMDSANHIGETILGEAAHVALNDAIELAGGWTPEEQEKLEALALGENVPDYGDQAKAAEEGRAL